MIELKYVHQVLAVKIFSILVYSMPDGHTDLNFAHQTAGTRQRKLLSTRSMLASASGIDLRKPKKNIRKMSISLISKTFTPHRTAESRYRPVVKSRKINKETFARFQTLGETLDEGENPILKIQMMTKRKEMKVRKNHDGLGWPEHQASRREVVIHYVLTL